MRIVLDRQHAGKGPGSPDYGAQADLDGDGRVEVHEREAMLTPGYILAAERRLVELGHEVIALSDGSYAARASRAIGYAADVVIACHVNAGGGDHGLVVHTPGSIKGADLARHVLDALGLACPELRRTIRGVYADDGAKTPIYTRAATCIGPYARARPVAAVFEPGFLDREEHRSMFTPEGLDRIGVALAEGLHRYASRS